MYVRQREQAPVIQRIGDIFLDAATDFRDPYPIYIGHYPLAEKRLREEMETNPEFRLFIEVAITVFIYPVLSAKIFEWLYIGMLSKTIRAPWRDSASGPTTSTE